MTINPVDGALRLESTREPGRALTSDQVFDLLTKLDASEYAARHDLPDFVRLRVATGERIGEVLGARWVDLDESERLLSMGRNVVRTSEGLIVREGKTERSRRDTPSGAWPCSPNGAPRWHHTTPKSRSFPAQPGPSGSRRTSIAERGDRFGNKPGTNGSRSTRSGAPWRPSLTTPTSPPDRSRTCSGTPTRR